MYHRCIHCSQNAGDAGYVDFEHDGLLFHVPKSKAICPHCLKQQAVTAYDLSLKEGLIEKSGSLKKPLVDWQKLISIRCACKRAGLQTLLHLGVLSRQPNNVWIVRDQQVNLNPHIVDNDLCLNFTTEDGARAYAKSLQEKNPQTLKTIEVQYVGLTISRPSFL